MGEKWVGGIVSGDDVHFVTLDFNNDGTITLLDQSNWGLQKGDRAQAYKVIYKTVIAHLNENKIQHTVLKCSAGRGGLSHLLSAELRGVVIAASAASLSEVRMRSRSVTSRTFGGRKVNDYIKDDTFWTDKFGLPLNNRNFREAAILVLAELQNGK